MLKNANVTKENAAKDGTITNKNISEAYAAQAKVNYFFLWVFYLCCLNSLFVVLFFVIMLIVDTEQCKEYYNRCIKFAEI